MIKETCPTCKQSFPFCSDCGRPIISIKKSVKKTERKQKISFSVSDKKENCSRCNAVIPRNIRFVIEKVYEENELVSESIVCATCMGVEKL